MSKLDLSLHGFVGFALGNDFFEHFFTRFRLVLRDILASTEVHLCDICFIKATHLGVPVVRVDIVVVGERNLIFEIIVVLKLSSSVGEPHIHFILLLLVREKLIFKVELRLAAGKLIGSLLQLVSLFPEIPKSHFFVIRDLLRSLPDPLVYKNIVLSSILVVLYQLTSLHSARLAA